MSLPQELRIHALISLCTIWILYGLAWGILQGNDTSAEIHETRKEIAALSADIAMIASDRR